MGLLKNHKQKKYLFFRRHHNSQSNQNKICHLKINFSVKSLVINLLAII